MPHAMNNDDIPILLDLKAAFDGYAGIPQETRLLFNGLRQLPQLQVKGLIQHGGRMLRPALTAAHDNVGTTRRILQMSKFIVSMNERPYSNILEKWADNTSRFTALSLLSTRMRLGMKLPHSRFDARLFPDFVWRTFFDKTLSPAEKDGITQDDYWVVNVPRNHLHKVGLKALAWGARPRYPVLDTTGFEFFIAQTPFPGRVSPGTRMVVRYHDAVPVLMPHTISDKAFHQSTHFQALRANVESGALFSCISEATRQDLLTIFPEAEQRTSVIHNMVSAAYHEGDAPRSLVPRIVRNRSADLPDLKLKPEPRKVDNEDFEYLLMVSTIEPRKNHLLLVSAWERLKYGAHPNLKLVVVGNPGWDHTSVMGGANRAALPAKRAGGRIAGALQARGRHGLPKPGRRVRLHRRGSDVVRLPRGVVQYHGPPRNLRRCFTVLRPLFSGGCGACDRNGARPGRWRPAAAARGAGADRLAKIQAR
jgi:glycosyltransferase involved in cell wall biosynthesis